MTHPNQDKQEAAGDFDAWWEREGQYIRAGGGQYEKSFAYGAWTASRTQPAYASADGLPPLPTPQAYEPNGREPTAYKAEQVRQAQRDVVASLRAAFDAAVALTGEPIEARNAEVEALRDQIIVPSRPSAPNATLSPSEIDDMAFGYCPSGKIGELREFAAALLSAASRQHKQEAEPGSAAAAPGKEE